MDLLLRKQQRHLQIVARTTSTMRDIRTHGGRRNVKEGKFAEKCCFFVSYSASKTAICGNADRK
jgi:hypothetical protein